MPKQLLDRCGPDCVQNFFQAASERYRDGVSLASEGRRTAAIYLWGYVAEMLLKASFFRAIGFSPTQQITLVDLRNAKNLEANRLGITWVGQLHSLMSWSQLLVSYRTATPGLAYPITGFGNEVVNQSRQLERIWSETLRYHKNVAYLHEVARARQAIEWLLANAPAL
jgi:hypothetical protein